MNQLKLEKSLYTKLYDLTKIIMRNQAKTVELVSDTQKTISEHSELFEKSRKIEHLMLETANKIIIGQEKNIELFRFVIVMNRLLTIELVITFLLVFKGEIFSITTSYGLYVAELWIKLGPEAKFALVFTVPAGVVFKWIWEKLRNHKK